ncbi:MAG: GGDEF domain-containing protein [Oscillospiraceae bacterium]|nr:GGDEF domain-containing protein [Oscillospiraceae bacterium]
MELSTYLFIVLFTAAFIAAFVMWRNARREKRKNDRLSALINTGQIYTITWSTDFRMIEVNDALSAFLKETGMKADEMFLKRLFLDDASIGTTGGVLLMGAMAKAGRKTSFTMPDGSEKHILWKSKIVGAEEACSIVASTGMDITEKVMLTAQLEDVRHNHAAVNEGLKVAAESADFGILTIRHANHGYVLDISPNGLSMLGMAEAGFVGFIDKLVPEDRDIFSDTVSRLFRGEMAASDLGVSIKVSENSVHRFVFRFKSVKSAADDLFRITAAFIDTSEERRHSLAHISDNHDPVTGFLKRNCFISESAEYLRESVSEELGVAVISIKIDHFRKISTLLGTDTAEKLLQVYAMGMEKCAARPSLFGKMSLDTFGGIIPCENRETAERFVKNLSLYIENACNGKMLPEILTGQSRFTAGICLYDENDDIVSAYNKAELSLIADFSENGGSCRFFSDEVAMKIYNRDIIEQELRGAVAGNELELYYQPKTNFDGEIYGAEALMRWNHPHNGLISPEAFIAIAEECGIITQIDEWGLMQACRQGRQWQEKGFRKIRISVNMSQDQLFKTDVVSSIRKALDETGFDPSQLEVELTETMAMQDIDRTIEILGEIRAMGVFVSMDDFGTGYSSLSALKLLPVDILKIDRSLICDICISSTSYNIIKAIVEMGKALGLEVLAEGIETEEQSEILRSLGCHIAQGYFYSKPLSAQDMEKMLSQQS